MSDLKLLTVSEEKSVSAITSGRGVPYPFEQIRAGAPLALRFQVYKLGLNDQGRTRYTVSYRARRRTKDDGLLGPFGEGNEQETTTATTYQGESRRVDEYITINLDDFVGDASGSVEVTVSVTDEVTGQQVDRSISFETIVPEDS